MKKSLLLLLLLLGISCSRQEKNVPTINKSAQQITTDLFGGLIIQLESFKKSLIVNDFQTEYLLSCMDATDGELLLQFGRTGNGPGELIAPVQVFTDQDTVYVYVRQRGVLYTTLFDEPNRSVSPFETKMDIGNNYDLLCKINDSTFIASGIFEKRFEIIDGNGGHIRFTGEFPSFWSGEKNIPDQPKAMYHQSRFSKHPKTNNIAISTADVLAIYEYSDDLVLKKEILLHPYEYGYTFTNMITQADKKPSIPRGIIDIASDERYIYLLYNPNTANDTSKKINEILVFSWQGEQVYTLRTKRNFTCIAIEADQRILYGVEQNEETTFWEVSLLDI